jgi:hypothetical protein
VKQPNDELFHSIQFEVNIHEKRFGIYDFHDGDLRFEWINGRCQVLDENFGFLE